MSKETVQVTAIQNPVENKGKIEQLALNTHDILGGRVWRDRNNKATALVFVTGGDKYLVIGAEELVRDTPEVPYKTVRRFKDL